MISTLNDDKSRRDNSIDTTMMSWLTDRYLAYVDKQEPLKVYWLVKALIIIPCLYMVVSIIAMAEMVERFEYYIGLTMVVFFVNVCVHIVDSKSRVYVPIFHLTTLFFILTPLVTYYVTQ